MYDYILPNNEVQIENLDDLQSYFTSGRYNPSVNPDDTVFMTSMMIVLNAMPRTEGSKALKVA